MVFRAVFLFEVHFQQSYRKKKLNNWKWLRNPKWLLKNAKNIWLQAASKDFWYHANPKFKKIKFINTLTSSGPYWRKCKNRGFWGVTFVFKWIKIFLHREFSNKSLTLKVCKTINGTKNFVKQILKSFSGRNIFLESPFFRFTNSLPYSLK